MSNTVLTLDHGGCWCGAHHASCPAPFDECIKHSSHIFSLAIRFIGRDCDFGSILCRKQSRRESYSFGARLEKGCRHRSRLHPHGHAFSLRSTPFVKGSISEMRQTFLNANITRQTGLDLVQNFKSGLNPHLDMLEDGFPFLGLTDDWLQSCYKIF